MTIDDNKLIYTKPDKSNNTIKHPITIYTYRIWKYNIKPSFKCRTITRLTSYEELSPETKFNLGLPSFIISII